MTCTSGSGTNSFTPASGHGTSFVSGYTYQIDVPISSWTAGTFTFSVCGVSTIPTSSPSAASDYRFYVTCSATTDFTVSLGGATQTMTFSNITAKRAGFDPNWLTNSPIIIDTNAGLTVPLYVYQPPALATWTFEEYIIAAYSVVDYTAQGTDTWEWGTSSYTSSLTFGTPRQTFLTLVSYSNGYWDIAGINGSVTPN
jgi:hypothetical protein